MTVGEMSMLVTFWYPSLNRSSASPTHSLRARTRVPAADVKDLECRLEVRSETVADALVLLVPVEGLGLPSDVAGKRLPLVTVLPVLRLPVVCHCIFKLLYLAIFAYHDATRYLISFSLPC